MLRVSSSKQVVLTLYFHCILPHYLPQCYYIGKTKKQIEELKKQAEENNEKILEQRREQINKKKYQKQ